MNTMTHGATVQLRVNAQTKNKSFDVFKKHGMTLTEGIRVYLERVASTREIPFSLNIPNEETEKSMRDSARGIGVREFQSEEDMFNHLHSLLK
jgi:DNA-damage-inducible protein J